MMSTDRKSTLNLLHIPEEFGLLLLTLTLILAISPLIGDTDLGIFKIPKFSQQVTSILIYLGPVLFVISIILHMPLWQQNEKEKDSQVSEHKMTDPAKEEAICLKAEADFQIFTRQFNSSPISETQLTKIEEQIKGNYSPYNVLVSSLNIRVEHYILPLVSELIKIESDLRGKHRVPFSQARIASIKDKIHALVKENWSLIIYAAYEDAIKHVVHHVGKLQEYKEIELSNLRDDLLSKNPDELFVIIDELLRKALADSILLAN